MPLTKHLLFLYVILAVSVGYFVSALRLGAPVYEGGLTPAFFPILVGMAAIVFASILIVQQRREGEQGTDTDAPLSYTHVWVVIAIFLYTLAFKPLGYFISSGLFVFALILLFSSFSNILQKLLISVAVVVVAYLMFEQLFGVRLPAVWG